MMPSGLQPWQRKALRNSWAQAKWALIYAQMGMSHAAGTAAQQAVKFYHHAFPEEKHHG